MRILNQIQENSKKNIKSIAVLIDPDKVNDPDYLLDIIGMANNNLTDYIFVGGSLITNNSLSSTIKVLKENTKVPVIIFPGSNIHIDSNADGLLFLSLISGRNPDLLIGQHVVAAPLLKHTNLEIMPVGYMLVGSEVKTSVAYMSNTNPIPSDKYSIASSTAIAGEMLGLRLIYLDGGSGGDVISQRMVSTVKSAINIPLIVGGGINTIQKATSILESGADLIVIGNALEKNPGFLTEVSDKVKEFNLKSGVNIH